MTWVSLTSTQIVAIHIHAKLQENLVSHGQSQSFTLSLSLSSLQWMRKYSMPLCAIPATLLATTHNWFILYCLLQQFTHNGFPQWDAPPGDDFGSAVPPLHNLWNNLPCETNNHQHILPNIPLLNPVSVCTRPWATHE